MHDSPPIFRFPQLPLLCGLLILGSSPSAWDNHRPRLFRLQLLYQRVESRLAEQHRSQDAFLAPTVSQKIDCAGEN